MEEPAEGRDQRAGLAKPWVRGTVSSLERAFAKAWRIAPDIRWGRPDGGALRCAVLSGSRPDMWHEVRRKADGTLACSCEAGLVGRLCWHVAAVALAGPGFSHRPGGCASSSPAHEASASAPTPRQRIDLL